MDILEVIIQRYNDWITIFLMVSGLYIVVARGNMIKKLVGLSLFQTSVFLLYISAGKVIGAGHLARCEGVDPCGPSVARVAEVDPTTFEVRPLVDYNGNEFFRLGTVAIEANDEIWIGGIRGSYGIARFPR